ncbi:Alcohol dehydrogenase superfamily zinc-containing [Lasiodiplodia theobromae]|uniref:Zinc-type alcohol dehydrogenase-like protein n=2 Tax=Lasiodiplodia TaxID=66739 RepID=A0A5N5DMX5_9PEZI|nr:Zinc-binding dehydrogenase [Lasiodiplodia theobromae]KAB2579173.1 Zinc-type alcohol dehydrogenase-like protein [Lasiodiplodia theobromae]KAF4537313.1 Zinc-binding dehydrogenase [Lasiodiplodia theobromae]KAF9639722.1 Alcohol dehydrogenase superfamily zinc-containing [Lasiodiplodia theobromae]KAK0661911.1 Zinc-type alcohol dehydrogenase-like protein [Lasiodiplodia hormozganensis]
MSENQVKQWLTLQNGLDKVYQGTAPMPSPRENEVLVEIRAVSLNYRDTEVAMGLYNHHKSVGHGQPEPLVLCADMCGVVTAVGEGAATVPWKVGDRVASIFNQTHQKGQVKAKDMASGLGLPLDGVLQTHRVFPSYGLVKVPEYMTDQEASCLPIAAVTAWMAINGMRPLGQPGGEGEVVLLQGTGGVSICGLQIAKASGAKVIVTSSSDDKLRKAQRLGADYLINYRSTPEWQDEVMKVTDDEGADIIFETGGARTLRKSFDSVAFGGLINSIGYLSGKEDEAGDRTNVNVLALRRNVTLKGILNGPRERFEEMCDFYRKHEIHPVIDREFPFDAAGEALQYLFSGGHFGKVVVKVKA